MARCYYLDYKSTGGFLSTSGVYYCKLCGQEFKDYDPKVKFTCNPPSGEAYKNCPVYKSKR